MIEMEGLDTFEDQVAALENAMASARDVTSGLSREFDRANDTMSDTGSQLRGLSSSLSRNLTRAFEAVVFDGEKLSNVLSKVGRSMVDSAFTAAMRPVSNQFSGLVSSGVQNLVSGVLPFAAGGVLSGGKVSRFAAGGIVDGATLFPRRGGMGLMGEAGPEAILPLNRGSDGRLGVRADGGGRPVNVVFNVTTPDVAGFRRSQSQIAAQMSRALGRGDRNR
jgi:lambda family phage tail tape measure protein